MCSEFVKEINTLLDMGKSNLQNATRYSYLISMQVDLETEQVDTFSGCIDHEAERDPRQAGIDIMPQKGLFDLYSNNDKAQVCQLATHTWDDLKSAQQGNGGTQPDICAVLTSHIF